MRWIKKMMRNIFCTFSILSILVGVLCKVGVLVNLQFSKMVFILFLMSTCTTLFVSLREGFIPESNRLGGLIDIIGCSVVIVLIAYLVGWLELSLSYLSLIIAMVIVVYLVVWLVTWLQSKHDEESLNRLLTKQMNRHPERKE